MKTVLQFPFLGLIVLSKHKVFLMAQLHCSKTCQPSCGCSAFLLVFFGFVAFTLATDCIQLRQQASRRQIDRATHLNLVTHSGLLVVSNLTSVIL